LVGEVERISREYVFIPRVEINLLELLMSEPYQKAIPDVIKYLTSADHLIACSEAGKKVLQSIGCKDITVIPTGIDPNMFKLSHCQEPAIGCLGRIMPVKNHLTLIQAFKLLRKDIPDSELIIVGGGNLVPVYAKIVELLGLQGQVGIFGYIESLDIFFNEIRVFVLPSFSEYLPQSVLEAYASGVPCVVSDAGWGDNFEAALKARPDCPWEWAEKLKLLLTDEELWRQVREKQLKELKEKFDINLIVEQYIELFKKLLKGRHVALIQPEKPRKLPPKVSVIVPVKNRRKLIKRCLDSILAEGYPNLEIIVVDGGSTDGTVEVLKEYAKNYPQIKFISEPDRNQSEAKNKGLAMATGDYVTFQDSDDEMIPGKLRLLSDFLEKNDRYFAVFGNTVPRSLDGEVYPISRPPKEISFETLSKNNYIGSGSIMLRNSPVVRFDENVRFGEDYKLWLTLIKKFNFGYVDRSVYYWTIPTRKAPHNAISLEADWKVESANRVKEVIQLYAGSPYDEDMRIAIFCYVFGQHPYGGPAIRGFNVCEMLYRGRKFFRVFYGLEPHPAYFKMKEVLRPWSDFNPKDFNVFYVMSGDVTYLNRLGIKPIIGSNHIPNSAPPHVLRFFEGDRGFMYLRERQIAQELEIVKRYKGKFWVAQSNFQKDEYRRLGVRDPVFILPNPINTQLFKRRRDYGDEIIWSGNAGWAKGLNRFLREIVKRFPKEQFHCLSDREMRDKYPPETLGENVKYTIGKTMFEVPEILQNGKIFISTSLTENQPLAVLEAMACELPVIAFRTSGIPEIIEDGKTGLLVELGNLDEYEEKLRWLLEDKKLRKKLGRNARKFVVENFSYEVCLDRYMEVFQKYLRWE